MRVQTIPKPYSQTSRFTGGGVIIEIRTYIYEVIVGLRGPKPKPTAIRVLEGNPSGRPLPGNEPQPRKVAKVEPPEGLTEDGKKIWKELSEEMIRIGLLTVLDLHALHRYVRYLLEYYDAERRINGVLVITMKWPNGQIRHVTPNPYLSIRNNASTQLSRLEQSLGLTPSARARMIAMVQGGAPPSEEDPYGD